VSQFESDSCLALVLRSAASNRANMLEIVNEFAIVLADDVPSQD